MKILEVRAANVDEAIEKGLAELGKTREQVEVEVLDKGGIIKKAKVLLTVKQEAGAEQRTRDFLTGLFAHMDINVQTQVQEDDDKLFVTISGEDSGTVIGYRGDVLDAVQYLTSLAVNGQGDDYKKVVIDCENYREKRTETLKSLAEKLADKAIRNGRKVFLEPMNPFERRIIHSALQQNSEVTTLSEGNEPNRYIVITPNNLTHDSRPGKPYRNDGARGGDRRDGTRGSGRREGGGNSGGRRDSRGGEREDRNARGGGYGGGRNSAKKSTSFSSFGTYLGNTRSGFSQETDFSKKSGFDNLKD